MDKAKKENGFILVIMVFLLLLLAVTAMSLNVKSGMQVKMATNQSDDTQVYFDQLAVIEESVWQLAKDPFWRPTQPSTSYHSNQYNRTVTNSAISSYTDAVTVSVRAPNASRPVNTSFRYNIQTPFLARKPRQVSSDSAGNIYFADMDNHRVWKIDVLGVPSLVAGNGASGFSGDGGQATEAQLNSPQGVCIFGTNIYIADTGNHRIRRVTGTTITTIAGTGTAGYGGDEGAATAALLNSPGNVAVDTAGNLYIADTGNNRIRKWTAATGIISLVAGTGASGSTGDDDLAINATLNSPAGVAVDGLGNIYIADTGNHRIRKVKVTETPVNINLVVGSTQGFSGDPGLVGSALLNGPQGVWVDGSGDNIYIADTGNQRIRQVKPWWILTIIVTIAGTGTAGYLGDGGLATAAQIDSPAGVCVTTGGMLLIADTMNSCLRKVEAGNITTWPATWPDPWPEKRTAGRGLNNPQGIAAYYDIAQKKVFLFIADTGNHRIRKLDPDAATDSVVTVAGTGSAGASGDGSAAMNATLNSPSGVAVDASGNVYIADTANHKIRKFMVGGNISLVAGTGAPGSTGDTGLAVNATLNSPAGVAVDASGNIYIADTGNNKIRKVTGTTITTVAGTGAAGHGGDGGAATSAMLNGPKGVALDVSGNLYIADTVSNRVRKVTAATGIINTVAGSASGGGYSGDGGAAVLAKIQSPQNVAVDAAGNLYIADTGNHALRPVNIHNGIIGTMTSNTIDPATSQPYSGYNGDLQPGVQARLNSPAGVALGLQKGGGRIFISDSNNNRIRMLFLKTVKEVYGP